MAINIPNDVYLITWEDFSKPPKVVVIGTVNRAYGMSLDFIHYKLPNGDPHRVRHRAKSQMAAITKASAIEKLELLKARCDRAIKELKGGK